MLGFTLSQSGDWAADLLCEFPFVTYAELIQHLETCSICSSVVSTAEGSSYSVSTLLDLIPRYWTDDIAGRPFVG